jgi:hypothetical protein
MTDKPPSDEELVAQERRIYRSNMAWSFGLVIAMTVLLFVSLWLANAGLLPWTIVNPLTFAVPPLFLVAMLFNAWWHRGPKKIRSEELITALRRRAGFAGYLGAMLLLGISSVIAFFRPTWAPQLILWMLVIGAVAPQLYYLVLEVRAGRGD